MQRSSRKNLLLVDFENIPKVDLSLLDASFRAIVFVGAGQHPPKASRQRASAHRFERVDFHKISGSGKNALDFHIAFELGRTFETAPETVCIVLSRDKGFDPLLTHLNNSGLICRRVDSMEDLVPRQHPVPEPLAVSAESRDHLACPRCKRKSTIEHHGGRWCSYCGKYASPPDRALLPSSQPGFVDRSRASRFDGADHDDRALTAECGWCHQRVDMTGGIYDDGEWMCGSCIAGYAR